MGFVVAHVQWPCGSFKLFEFYGHSFMEFVCIAACSSVKNYLKRQNFGSLDLNKEDVCNPNHCDHCS